MTNNDILRRLRFAFDFSDKQAAKLFSLDPQSSVTLSPAEFIKRLYKDSEADYIECSDQDLAAFLDGLIVMRRGLREPNTGVQIPKETALRLSKNDILKKLRIAMNYREQEMLDTLKLGGTHMSKSELGALFRKPQHKHFRACGNQVLRNFIKGLNEKMRG